MRRKALVLLAPILLLMLLSTAACGGQTAPARPAGKLQIVATTNILADWVRVVGQDRVEVLSLLPPNVDAHGYQPGARDITRIADADKVFSIGLSLEERWLTKLIENAAQDPHGVVFVGDVVDPIGEASAHGELDPHFWFDPLRVKQAVNSIAAQLSSVDPAGQSFYRTNAASYANQLDDLHDWISAQVAQLPEDRRLLVTSHDSFQYFAKRYGFKVVGAIFPVTTDSGPTAQDLSSLIETIEYEGAPAVFTEKSYTDRLSRRIAEETGAKLVGGLYTGSLGEPGSEAGTYLDLMRYNTTTIVEALQ